MYLHHEHYYQEMEYVVFALLCAASAVLLSCFTAPTQVSQVTRNCTEQIADVDPS